MKKIKIIIVVILLGAITSTYAQDMVTDDREMSKYTNRRDPWLAAGLSLITFGFGGGQYYNKQYLKALILTGLNAGTITWAILHDEGDGFLAGLEEALVYVAVAGATWIYSMIDAPVCAININETHGFDRKVTIGPTLERNRWDPGKFNVGLKLSLSLD